MATQVPVLVVDDDDLLGDALVAVLRADGIQARAFASAADLFDNLPDVACACVISDLVMPDMDGAQLLRRIVAGKGRAWPVILMTAHAEVAMAVDMMKAGAADFIEKPISPDMLLSVVKSCIDRSQAVAASLSARFDADLRLSQLSPREAHVYRAIINGGNTKTIAEELTLSPRTVEKFRARVMEKMGVKTLTALVKLSHSAESVAAGSLPPQQ